MLAGISGTERKRCGGPCRVLSTVSVPGKVFWLVTGFLKSMAEENWRPLEEENSIKLLTPIQKDLL